MLEIVMLKTNSIKPYERNPRWNDQAVDAVAKSIQDLGFRNPIIVDAEHVIICGHTRYKAAKVLKLNKVPCIVASDLSEEQVKAFRLADNKVGELAQWDFDLLRNELDTLPDDVFTGFMFDELARIAEDCLESLNESDKGAEKASETILRKLQFKGEDLDTMIQAAAEMQRVVGAEVKKNW